MDMDSDLEKRDDRALEALFDAGRATRPVPSDAFMARLEAEAVPPRPAPRPAPARTFWQGFGFPGLFAASGLSLSAVAGVLIGFASPDLVSPYASLATTTDETATLYTFLPGADLAALDE